MGVVYEDGEIGIINDKGKEILKMTDDIDDLGGFNAAGIGCYKENNKFGWGILLTFENKYDINKKKYWRFNLCLILYTKT